MWRNYMYTSRMRHKLSKMGRYNNLSTPAILPGIFSFEIKLCACSHAAADNARNQSIGYLTVK